MTKKIIQRFLPDPNWIRSHQSLRFLGTWLHNPNIWHLNRHSVSIAVFIGLFMAFVPLPSQMIMAALTAILFRVNLPVSVVLVWVSNPLTMAPIFYMAYKVGFALIGHSEVDSFAFELSWQWLTTGLATNWQPFLLGCLVCGLFCGLVGSVSVNFLWRRHVIKRWHQRRLVRKQRKSNR